LAVQVRSAIPSDERHFKFSNPLRRVVAFTLIYYYATFGEIRAGKRVVARVRWTTNLLALSWTERIQGNAVLRLRINGA